MTQGQRVSRSLWGPGRWICIHQLTFMLRSVNGWLVPWEPKGIEFVEDVLSVDWLPVPGEDAAPVMVRDEEPR